MLYCTHSWLHLSLGTPDRWLRWATIAFLVTGGFFVATPWDDPDYGDRFRAGCYAHGVPVDEIPVATVLRREPRINPRISRAFEVADAAADSFLTVAANVASARIYGARVLTYHRVTRLIMEGRNIAF